MVKIPAMIQTATKIQFPYVQHDFASSMVGVVNLGTVIILRSNLGKVNAMMMILYICNWRRDVFGSISGIKESNGGDLCSYGRSFDINGSKI